MPAFSIRESLSVGWNILKKRPLFVVFVPLFVWLVATILSTIISEILFVLSPELFGTILDLIISIAIGTVQGIAVIMLYLKLYDDTETATIGDAWQPQLFWPFLGASLLIGIMVFIGLLIFVIPGIIVAMVFYFTTYIVVDKNLGPINALKESARITEGHRWRLFLFSLAVVGINLVGALVFFVGLFITVPITALALIHIYRTLEQDSSEVVEVQPI